MTDFDAVNTLANEEVDFAIRMIPSFANLFRNQTADFERIGVQKGSGFLSRRGMGNCYKFLRL